MKKHFFGKKLFSVALAVTFSALSINSSHAATSWTRIAGADRTETSIKAAQMLESNTLVFANGRQFPDALSSVNICTTKNGKLILVNGNEDYSNFVKENEIEKVYIIGGTSSISKKFEENLKTTSAEVKRLSGSDRYLTNAKTIEESELQEVGVASGENFADALASTGFLKENNAGLVLVPPSNKLPVKDVVIKYAFGGKSSVDVAAETVFAGKDRYDTALKIAEATESYDLAFVNGADFPDALSAVNVVNSNGVDVVFAPRAKSERTMSLCEAAEEIFVVGGNSSVSEESMELAINGYYEKIVKDFGEVQVVDDGSKTYLRNVESGEVILKDENNKGIVDVDGHRYLINEDGSLKLGFIKEGSNTYYAKAETGLARGFLKDGQKIYYFDPIDYYMYHGGPRNTGLTCYWFGDDGAIKEGTRMSGFKKDTPVKWYMPTAEDLKNTWLEGSNQQNRFLGQKIANYACERAGIPFKWYGFDLNDKSGVYCVGAIYSAYKENGIAVPGPKDCDVKADGGYRMVEVQYKQAPKYGGKYIKTDFNNLLPGDLPYSARRAGQYNHGAIYIGKNGGRPMTAHATLAGGFIIEEYSRVYSWKYHDLQTVRYLYEK